MKDIQNGNYQVGYVLTANGLSRPEWAQRNYYAGMGGDYTGTYLETLTQMPRVIFGMVFNDVAVDVAPMKGVEGSLPSSIKTAEEYTHTYTFDISGNDLIVNPEDLVVNALVIDKNTGAVINSNKFALGADTGVEGIMDDVEVISTEYFNLNGMNVRTPTRGVVIKRETLSDGTYRTNKIIF